MIILKEHRSESQPQATLGRHHHLQWVSNGQLSVSHPLRPGCCTVTPRPRLCGIARSHTRFKKRLEPLKILIELQLRVRAEDLRNPKSEHSTRWVIGHPDIEPSSR